MKKFVFVYYGSQKPADISKEEMDAVMAKWGAWFESMGDKLVDGGNPFGPDAQSVTAAGAEAIAADMWPAKGYSIVNADDMSAATEMAKGCPVVADDPEGSVRVYEALPM